MDDLTNRLMAAERERIAKDPPPTHYTELPPDSDPNWSAYLREVGRLLAEGNEGRWALIHMGELVDVFDTDIEAFHAGRKLGRTLIRPIRTWEPAIRTPTFMVRCRNSSTRLRPTG